LHPEFERHVIVLVDGVAGEKPSGGCGLKAVPIGEPANENGTRLRVPSPDVLSDEGLAFQKPKLSFRGILGWRERRRNACQCGSGIEGLVLELLG
jgi:hypothetical protein